jgi:two-component sensor histidine kinase
MTLRSGLVLVVLAGLLPMAILSIIQGRAAWRDARALATTRLQSQAWLIAEGERDAFIIARHALQTASRSRAVRTMDGQCSAALVNAHRGTTGIANFTRSDATGRIRCSALNYDGSDSFAREPWWQRAIKIDGLSVSKPIIGKISKKPIIVLALPLRSNRGDFDGVATASISLDTLQTALARRSDVNPDALIEIVGVDGSAILSNRKVALVRPVRWDVSDDFSLVKSQDGADWQYAHAPLFGKDLTIIYAKPSTTLLAAGMLQFRQSIWLPLIAMVVASLAIWTGTHWLVVRWLRKLQSLAGQFTRGDYIGNKEVYRKAPKEIAALSDDLHGMATTIANRDQSLNAALAAKIALTREVNHRVKNNLQIVTSLLTLQADRVADPWARDALGQAKARIGALGLIHRVLYEHDAPNKLGTVNMRLLMAELCPQLRAANRTYSNIDLRCSADDLELSVDQAVPLTLFIVEVVTNAFRHGYGENQPGNISITMTVKQEQVDLAIADDGDGYVGVDAVGKMGFELMNAFAAQLSGVLNMCSSSSGTTVTLRHPVAPY